MRTVDIQTEIAERAAVVRIAREYQGTPYHPHARVKGIRGGVDCLTFIVGVYEDAGLIQKQDLPHYEHLWHLHKYEERYVEAITKYTTEVEKAEAGDLVLFKMGKCFSHGVICLEWPTGMHAYFGRNVFETDMEKDGALVGRPRRFYSFWQR